VQQILESTSKVLIDAKAGSNLLYLPLDRIMRMSASGALPEPLTAPATSAGETPAASDSAGRSRDALRGRERGERP
jgi:membrane protease subunit HflK